MSAFDSSESMAARSAAMGFAPAVSTPFSSMQAKKKSPTLRSGGVRSASGFAAEASRRPQRNCRFSVAVLP